MCIWSYDVEENATIGRFRHQYSVENRTGVITWCTSMKLAELRATKWFVVGVDYCDADLHIDSLRAQIVHFLLRHLFRGDLQHESTFRLNDFGTGANYNQLLSTVLARLRWTLFRAWNGSVENSDSLQQLHFSWVEPMCRWHMKRFNLQKLLKNKKNFRNLAREATFESSESLFRL